MINILSQPKQFTPVYNDIIFGLSSSTVNQPNYRYVGDLFINNDFKVRLKTFPDKDGYGYFRLNRVCQDYLSYDLQPQQPNINTLFYGNDNSIKNIQLKLYDEYGSLNTGTTIFTSSTVISQSIITYNGALSYYGDLSQNYTSQRIGITSRIGTNYFTEYSYKDYTADKLSNVFYPPLFLTNSPREIKCNMADVYYISIFVDEKDDVSELYIETFNNNTLISGYSISNTTNNNPVLTGTSNADCFLTIGIAPRDINSAWYGSFPLLSPIINNNVDYYTVRTRYVNPLNPADIEDTSEIFKVIIDNSNNYDKFRFRFLNIFGAFDSYTFDARNSQTKNVLNKSEYKKILGKGVNGAYIYPNGDKSLTQIYSQIENNYKVTSNWLTEKQSYHLNELFNSPVVFLEVNEKPKKILNTINNGGILEINYVEPHYYKADDIIAIFSCDNASDISYSSVGTVLSDTSIIVTKSYFNITNGFTTTIGKNTKLIPIDIINTSYNIKQSKPRLISVDINFKLANSDPRQSGIML
jgi:hypothetical protein